MTIHQPKASARQKQSMRRSRKSNKGLKGQKVNVKYFSRKECVCLFLFACFLGLCTWAFIAKKEQVATTWELGVISQDVDPMDLYNQGVTMVKTDLNTYYFDSALFALSGAKAILEKRKSGDYHLCVTTGNNCVQLTNANAEEVIRSMEK